MLKHARPIDGFSKTRFSVRTAIRCVRSCRCRSKPAPHLQCDKHPPYADSWRHRAKSRSPACAAIDDLRASALLQRPAAARRQSEQPYPPIFTVPGLPPASRAVCVNRDVFLRVRLLSNPSLLLVFGARIELLPSPDIRLRLVEALQIQIKPARCSCASESRPCQGLVNVRTGEGGLGLPQQQNPAHRFECPAFIFGHGLAHLEPIMVSRTPSSPAIRALAPSWR